MEKYKINYRVFTREPLLSHSVDYVFTATKFFNEPMKFATELAEFGPGAAEDIVTDLVERHPDYAGKTFWVQQNGYRLENAQFEYYARICFTSFRVDHFPFTPFRVDHFPAE